MGAVHVVAVVVVAAVSPIAAAPSSSGVDSSDGSVPVVTIRMGTVAPTGSPWHKVLRQMGEDWERTSGGRVNLIILAGGTLGDELAMVQKMRAGVLQGVAISGAGLPCVRPTRCSQTNDTTVRTGTRSPHTPAGAQIRRCFPASS